MYKNLYTILNLHPTASKKLIKSAFRRLAKRHHPDMNPDNPHSSERFQDICEAYDILRDEKKRAAYDKEFAFVIDEEAVTFSSILKDASSRKNNTSTKHSPDVQTGSLNTEERPQTESSSFKDYLNTAMGAEKSPYVLCEDGIIRLRSRISKWVHSYPKRNTQTKWKAFLFSILSIISGNFFR